MFTTKVPPPEFLKEAKFIKSTFSSSFYSPSNESFIMTAIVIKSYSFPTTESSALRSQVKVYGDKGPSISTDRAV